MELQRALCEVCCTCCSGWMKEDELYMKDNENKIYCIECGIEKEKQND